MRPTVRGESLRSAGGGLEERADGLFLGMCFGLGVPAVEGVDGDAEEARDGSCGLVEEALDGQDLETARGVVVRTLSGLDLVEAGLQDGDDLVCGEEACLELGLAR